MTEENHGLDAEHNDLSRQLRKLEDSSSDKHKEQYEAIKAHLEGTSKDWEIHTGGLATFPLQEAIFRWMRELERLGLTDAKDGAAMDVPPQDGFFPVIASDGRTVLVKPKAYKDGEDWCADVRAMYSRTDGAILGMISILEGSGGGDDEDELRNAYRVWHNLPEAEGPPNAVYERLIVCAEAMTGRYFPSLECGTKEHREKVVGFARRIHRVSKATRELQEFAADRKSVGKDGDPALDVRAAELRMKNTASGKMTFAAIGKKLGIPPTPSELQSGKTGNQNAKNAVERGYELLDQLPKK